MSSIDDSGKIHSCVVCKEPVRDGALKCTKCKSYQLPWPRRVSFLAPILSSFISVPVSVIAIGTALYSLARVELTAADSKMDYSFQNAESGFIIVGYNSGNRPATFANIILTIPNNGDIELTEKTNKPISIEPSKDAFISLAPPNTLQSSVESPPWPKFEQQLQLAKCNITFVGTKFSGERDQVGPKEFECKRIACWLYRQQWSQNICTPSN